MFHLHARSGANWLRLIKAVGDRLGEQLRRSRGNLQRSVSTKYVYVRINTIEMQSKWTPTGERGKRDEVARGKCREVFQPNTGNTAEYNSDAIQTQPKHSQNTTKIKPKYSQKTTKIKPKQDQVNNADSAIIFLINHCSVRVGLNGPRGSRGRPTRSHGVKG